MSELSHISYDDSTQSIRLQCYADTLVYNKVNSSKRQLVAMRFGGYPEQVRAMSQALRKEVSITAIVEDHPIILSVGDTKYKRNMSHDGNYAEGILMALDDDAAEMQDTGKSAIEKPRTKRRMYIFCDEGDTDALYAELDKKTSIPLLPEFKDYILSECLNKNILAELQVLSAGVRFDAYLLELRNDEKDMEAIVNKGLKEGYIRIPDAIPGNKFQNIQTVSQYLNRYGVVIADRIRQTFNPLFDPAAEDICGRLKKINGDLKKTVGYTLYPAQLAVAEALKRRLDKAKVGLIVAECGSGKTKIGAAALAAHQDGRQSLNVILCPSHVTKKWVREIGEILPGASARVVYSLADINRAVEDYKRTGKSMYMVLSKERARDGYMRRPAAVYSQAQKAFICPSCGKPIEVEITEDGTKYRVYADQFTFRRETTQNHKCLECSGPLWTALNPADKRLSHNKWIKIGGYGFVYREFAKEHLETTKDVKVMARLKSIIENPKELFMARGAYLKYSMSGYISAKIKRVDGLILDELHRAPVKALY